MKQIILGEKTIDLNIGEEITVKEMRIIYPIMKKHKEDEIELIVQILKALSPQSDIEEYINSLSLEDFAIIAEQVGDIIDKKKR